MGVVWFGSRRRACKLRTYIPTATTAQGHTSMVAQAAVALMGPLYGVNDIPSTHRFLATAPSARSCISRRPSGWRGEVSTRTAVVAPAKGWRRSGSPRSSMDEKASGARCGCRSRRSDVRPSRSFSNRRVAAAARRRATSTTTPTTDTDHDDDNGPRDGRVCEGDNGWRSAAPGSRCPRPRKDQGLPGCAAAKPRAWGTPSVRVGLE